MKNLLLIFLIGLTACNQQTQVESNSPDDKVRINPQIGFKPNILWIVAEDLGPYIPAFGDSTIVTPVLDKLASTGVVYDNFYAPHPVCAPARASIITGMYANSIGASHMRTGPWFPGITEEGIKNYKALPEGFTPYEAIPPPEVKMFTEYLRSAGYYCTNNSKEDYQFRKTMTAWDESSTNAHWRNRPAGSPFFSVFNIGVTHESRIWAKMLDSLWVDENLEVPVPPYLPDTKIGRGDIRRMYSNILEMDAQVGEILDQLETDGLMDSTIIIWYTDHGGPLPRQKRMLYESGVKVPMIIRFPEGEFGGLRDDRMISFIDLAPATLSLAGMKPPDYMQGSAFIGNYIRSEEPEYVFGAADRFDELTDRARSVRDNQFKYIKYYMPEKPMYLDVAYRRQMPIMQELIQLREADQLTKEQALWFRNQKPNEELFDILNDPHEINNLADDPDYEPNLLELRKACEEWVLVIEDSGLRPESELISEIWPDGIQPVTANPQLTINESGINISCSTEGASIGYKIIIPDEVPAEQDWSVYNKPFKKPEDAELLTVAHRIGYKRSEVIRLSNN
jgi:arylsulfatase A-like enzyme